MRKNITLWMLAVLFSTFNVFADDCFQPLDAGRNMIGDPELTSLSNFTGWGNRSIVTVGVDEDAMVYCGETAGKIWGSNGGSIDANVSGMSAGSAYRVRAMVYVVETPSFQFGVLNDGDKITISTVNQWVQVDEYFIASGTPGGLYFNNTGKGGDVGYIDNWELYEWSVPAVNVMNEIKAAKEIYSEDGVGADVLKAKMDEIEVLLAELTPADFSKHDEALVALLAELKEIVAEYKANNPNADGYVEIEGIILNPSFEADGATSGYGGTITNWTMSGGQGYKLHNSSGIDPYKAGTYFAESWIPGGSNLDNMELYQVVTGLKEGTYKIQASGHGRQDGDGTFGEGFYLFANNSQTMVADNGEYGVEVAIVAGTLKVGVKTYGSTCNWVAIDNFKLYYKELTAAAFEDNVWDIYEELISYEDQKMSEEVKNDLFDILDEAQALLSESPTLEQLRAIAAKMSAYEEVVITSIASYKSFATAIANAEAAIDGNTGLTDFQASIAAAKAIYNAGSADDAGVATEIDKLTIALRKYQSAPASTGNVLDMTSWIENPSFEATTRYAGWISENVRSANMTNSNTAIDDNKSSDYASVTLKDSTNYAEQWIGTPSALPDMSIYQTLNVPNGNYTIYVSGHARNQVLSLDDNTVGTYFYVNEKQVEMESRSRIYSIDVVVMNQQLTMGIKTVSTEANWIAWDNFRLETAGYDATAVYDAFVALLAEAKEVVGTIYQTDLKASLEAAITEGNKVTGPNDSEAIANAATLLTDALIPARLSMNAYADLLAAIAEVKAILAESTDYNKTAEYIVVNDSITSSEAVYAALEADVATVSSYKAAMETAKDNLVSLKDTYIILKETIDAATAAAVDGKNELATLKAAIAVAEAVYAAKTESAAPIEEATNTLAAALSLFNVINVVEGSPVDATALLANPSFEADNANTSYGGTISGWNMTGGQGFKTYNSSSFDPYKDGSYFVESWVGDGGTLADTEIYQIANIPNGVYEITVSAFATQSGAASTGTYFYANWETMEIGTLNDYTLRVKVSQGCLTFGVKLESSGANWCILDNFRLTAVAPFDGVNIQEVAAEIPFVAYFNGNDLNVKFNLDAASDVDVAVYNAQGALVAKQQGAYHAGESIVTMNSPLTSGVYLVQLTCNGQQFVKKIVK